MKIVVDAPIDAEKLKELLNKVLNEYNISVNVVPEPEKASDGRYVYYVYAELINPVKYSAYFSQVYDQHKVRTAEQLGLFLRNPKLKFGVSSKVLHWYHWAMLNDTLTYILDRLGVDYEIRSAAGKFRGWREWREQLKHLTYDPELDPAFRKRVAEPVKSVHGVNLYEDIAKMIESLKTVEKKLLNGPLAPSAIEEIEEAILEVTKASTFYEGIHSPASLREHKPRFRAWMKLKYGDRAESVLQFMTSDEIDEEYSDLEDFLNSVDSKSTAFQRYLSLWIEELELDLIFAGANYGFFVEKLEDKDDAGFPLELAKKLLTEPFKPNIDDTEIRNLIKKEVEEEVEYVSG